MALSQLVFINHTLFPTCSIVIAVSISYHIQVVLHTGFHIVLCLHHMQKHVNIVTTFTDKKLNTTISLTTWNTKFFMSKNINFYLTTLTGFHI